MVRQRGPGSSRRRLRRRRRYQSRLRLPEALPRAEGSSETSECRLGMGSERRTGAPRRRLRRRHRSQSRLWLLAPLPGAQGAGKAGRGRLGMGGERRPLAPRHAVRRRRRCQPRLRLSEALPAAEALIATRFSDQTFTSTGCGPARIRKRRAAIVFASRRQAARRAVLRRIDVERHAAISFFAHARPGTIGPLPAFPSANTQNLRPGRAGIMRCILCGAEMRVMQSDQDDSMMVAGYEHQKLECSSCHEVETRTVFSRDAAIAPDQPMPVDIGPATLAVLQDDGELDEREALLQNAIEMVRSATPSPGIARGPHDSVRSLRARISGPSRFVRIRRGAPDEAPYVAIDAKTGMTVLRYQDSARLREMCDWMGWRVSEDETAADAPEPEGALPDK